MKPQNEIPCGVIQDLMPLYNEGLCSEDSIMLVEEHLQTCEECREIYGQLDIPTVRKQSEPSEAETFKKINKKLKSSKITKIMSAVLCVFLVIFGIWNVSWYFLKYRPYDKLCSNMQPSGIGKGTQFRTEDAQFSYMVKMPEYLSFEGGFISISPVNKQKHDIYIDENGNPEYDITPYVVMFIWPQINGETVYGADIICGSVGYQMYIDKSLNLIPFENQSDEEIEKYEKMISEQYDKIKALMNAADNMWGFDAD
ncbi:MAG: zf-HC2 domain-containing protein [Ruminococcus sp.]|nr:zf-HC2 domain-containing protein [Ruminococcus sp.]